MPLYAPLLPYHTGPGDPGWSSLKEEPQQDAGNGVIAHQVRQQPCPQVTACWLSGISEWDVGPAGGHRLAWVARPEFTFHISLRAARLAPLGEPFGGTPVVGCSMPAAGDAHVTYHEVLENLGRANQRGEWLRRERFGSSPSLGCDPAGPRSAWSFATCGPGGALSLFHERSGIPPMHNMRSY